MSDIYPTGPIDRREFLRRAATATGLAVGTCALGLGLWDRDGPGAAESSTARLLPDYSIPARAGKLAIARGPDRAANAQAAVNALGGLQLFIKPGDRVLLKVNAAFAAPPILGATTHPDLVSAMARMCFAAGAARVLVTDNPINDPASCFELSGIGPAARAAGARTVLPGEALFERYSVPGAGLITDWPVLTAPLRQVDKLIGLCPVKDHHRSGASMTLKNWYGLLGGRRNIFHQQIHTIISELALLVKPTLVVLDGTRSMIRNGPTGGSIDDLKPTHTLIAGTDPVAVDAMGATLLGMRSEDLPYLALAEKAGAGQVDYQALRPVEVNGAP
jgi:uncharacterized protein (DUF362 family)